MLLTAPKTRKFIEKRYSIKKCCRYFFQYSIIAQRLNFRANNGHPNIKCEKRERTNFKLKRLGQKILSTKIYFQFVY